MLVNRVLDHALACPGDKDLDKKIMTDSQVRAALGLMKKILPDLQATELSQDPEKPLNPMISDKPVSKDEWANTYSLGSASRTSESVN